MEKKILTVYYSWSNGNTRRIAEMVQKAVGGDLAPIETVDPYNGSYQEVVDQGQEEVNRGYSPPIQPLPFSVQDYDIIVIGTPTWWYTMAPAVLTYLTENSWQGKTVIPFMTNGGWPGHVIKDMGAACSGAHIAHAKEIRFDSNGGDQLVTPQTDLNAWIETLKEKIGGKIHE